MAESESMTFKATTGEQYTIQSQHLVASIPCSDAPSTSTIIYLEPNEKDDTALPTVKIIPGDLPPTTQQLPDTSDTETHIIISTRSGTNQAPDFYEDVLKPILSTLFPKGHGNFLIHHTKSANTITELTTDIFLATANAGISLRIILLSGDGGIIDLVNGFLTSPHSPYFIPPQVIVLPLGTANALYHSITPAKENNNNTWGLRALVSQATKPLPIFTATFSPGARLLTDEARKEEALPLDPTTGSQILHGAVVCSWGMHASLVADSDTAHYRQYGVERFKMAAKEALYPSDGSLPHAYKANISILKTGHDGSWHPLTPSNNSHLYVLASMVSNLEKPFCISPATKPLDGSMHLVYFGPVSGDEAMRIMGLAYQGGKHVADEQVRYVEIEGLRITFDGEEGEKEKEARWRRVCVDGKIVRVEEDGWVEVRKEGKRVLDIVVG